MSNIDYPPKSGNELRFNPDNFKRATDALTLADADRRYLRLSGGSISGSLAITGNLDIQTLSLNGTSLDLSGLQYITGLTAGTAQANKALVLGATKNISGISSITMDMAGTGLNIPALSFNGTSFNQNYYLSITEGGATATKAVVLNSTLDYSGIRNLSITGAFTASTSISSPSLTTNSITLNGTLITATAAEINFLDITAAGTAQASKALVLDGSRNITNINSLITTSLDAANIGSVNTITFNNTTNTILTSTKGTSGFRIYHTTNDRAEIGTATATPFTIFTDNSIRMFVSSTGDVSIGNNTATPNGKLDVNGSLYCNAASHTFTSTGDTVLKIIANNTSTNMWPTIDFIRQNTSNAFGGDAFVDWRISNRVGDLVFFAADNSIGSTEIMRITSLGLVGIGTNAPNAPLHIVGNSRSFTIGSVSVYGEYGSGAFAANQLGPISRNISIRCDNGIFTSTSLFCSSDRRLKKNIDDLEIEEAMNFVKMVNPKKYHLNIDDDNAHKHYGFVAQDILKLGPAFVDLLNFSEREDFAATEEGDIKDIALSVDYQKISVLLHKVLKDTLDRVDKLEYLVNKLTSRPVVSKWLSKNQ